MRNPFGKFFLVIIGIMLMYNIAHCQTQYDYNPIWLCDATGTTFYRILLNRSTSSTTYVFGNFTPAGIAYVPTAPISSGPCNGGLDTITVNLSDSAFQYIPIEMCDDSLTTPVSFIRVYRYGTKQSTGTNAKKFIGDFKTSDGSAYTPSTQIYSGFCGAVSIDEGNFIYSFDTTNVSGTLDQADNALSIEILNAGEDTATLTVNGSSFPLLAGQSWFCVAVFDEMTKVISLCPAVDYDCTTLGSTTLMITQRRRQ